MASKTFNELMGSSRKTVVKLELLDSYSGAFEEEARLLQKFVKDGGITEKELWESNGDWYKETQKLKDRGVLFTRIHVVTSPMTDYIKFEMESYKVSEQHGEEIYLIDRKEFAAIEPIEGVQRADFLVFDSDNVVINKFEVDGSHNATKFLGVEFLNDKKSCGKIPRLLGKGFKKGGSYEQIRRL